MEKWYPSRWGDGDVLGSFNLITERSILEALQLVRQGKVYDLSFVLEQGMPIPEFHGQFFANTQYSLETGMEWHVRRLGYIANGYSAQNLRIAMSDHSGTHIDQLNHVGQQLDDGDFLVYNGVRNSEIISTFGTRRFGIEHMPPLIGRGVLADVAGHKGVDYLPIGYAITPEELDAALAAHEVEVHEGDTVLVRTGWGQKWGKPDEFLVGEPGLSRACAEWAEAKNIICWGIDQFATDPIPFEREGEALPMHLEMLMKRGIRLMENVYLEEIARDRIYVFCIIAAPLKIRGGTGSPVRLLALV